MNEDSELMPFSAEMSPCTEPVYGHCWHENGRHGMVNIGRPKCRQPEFMMKPLESCCHCKQQRVKS